MHINECTCKGQQIDKEGHSPFSIMNSYVEGTASFLKVCGQKVRNSIKLQQPDKVLECNEEVIKTMKEVCVFKKPVMVVMD